MAKTSPSSEESAAGSPAAPPAKGSILGKILVLGLVAVVVAVECVVAYLCIPSATESTAAASSVIKPPADHKKGEAEPAADNDGEKNQEVDLKEYSVTIYQPASNSTLRIDFHLHGIVAKDKKADFDRLFEANLNRFREQVMVSVRSAEMADLSDPSLGLIKRTILEKSKKILGQPLLQEIIVSEYSSLEN